ncbi:MAG: glutathione S-transferase C-terminal domain-containing protein [Alphaproteobacteria bacterium]
MGMLVDGIWGADAEVKQATDGSFIRPESPYREFISNPDKGKFPAEAGRYELIVAYACPWAHRTLLYRALHNLEDVIGISVVHPISYPNGWHFGDYDGVINNTGIEITYLHQLYKHVDNNFTGKVTVPTLWDKKTQTIVNNESSEIIRMLDGPFCSLLNEPKNQMTTLYDIKKIEEMNDLVYRGLNNGVYRVGFAKSQEAYTNSVNLLFDTLDKLENILNEQPFLLGNTPCEADWRLLPTLVRFDPVYFYHFKCNKRQLRDYSMLHSYMHRLLDIPKVMKTVKLDHIIDHYYLSHLKINPNGIIPVGVSYDIADL